MTSGITKMNRSKSGVKTTSSRSYPYPRTHTTLMVIPSTRPVEKPDIRPPRRRPPLNKTCPTIPESNSNESIMSHASRKSEKASSVVTGKQQEPLGLVIENTGVVNVLHRLDNNAPSSRTMDLRKTKTSTPKSPLLSVAHSVRNKFNKITQFARSSHNQDEACGSMKGSKSFSGIRQPKTIPKRTDQNANRVIKSSSMDVPKMEQQPCSSKVFIPQSTMPLDDRIEEMSETGLIPSCQLAPNDKLCVKLDDDVLVVTSEQFYPGQKRSASPDPPLQYEKDPTFTRTEEKSVSFDDNGNPQKEILTTTTTTERILKEGNRLVKETEVTETITKTTRVDDEPEDVEMEEAEDKKEFVVETIQLESNKDAVLQFEFKEEAVVQDKNLYEDDADQYVMFTKPPQLEEKFEDDEIGKVEVIATSPSEPEKQTRSRIEDECVSPERYVMLVKSPESHRAFNRFEVGEKDPVEKVELMTTSKSVPEKLQKTKKRTEEECISPERYVMLVKSPESHRAFNRFEIGEKTPKDDVAPEVTSILRSKSDAHVSKKLKFEKQKSEPERMISPERFVMIVKTPEALRKHKTLTIGVKEPMVKSESEVQIKKPKKLLKQKSEPERYVSPERYILTVKTPEALRKHRTLMIGEATVKIGEPVVPTVTKMTSLEKTAMKEKLKKDKSVERPEPPTEKFVMVMKTPEGLRRHHTFTVGDRPKSPDYPYIEEGEITEPIATVGPPADRRRKQEKKEEKRRNYEESQKPPPEKYIMTATTPIALRKYQTFTVEPKKEQEVIPVERETKKEKMKRSQSCEQKKSYLQRLQFDLFRGRSRERKSNKDARRQKSLDETKASSTQKYVLSTTTPLVARKYQTFAIEEKATKNEDKIVKNLVEETVQSPVKTSDLYSFTVTTPLMTRRNENKSDRNSLVSPHPESIEKAPSPESRKLFVMGGRRPTTPREDRIKIDSPNRSISTNAERLERKSSLLSDDLTSPEEDIPLDSIVPTEKSSRKTSKGSSKAPLQVTSPENRDAPVFVPPSPPKSPLVKTKSISTSTSTSSSTSEERKAKLTQLPLKKTFEMEPAVEVVKTKKKEKIAVKSLRNASKRLTPSFLKKERKPAHGRELIGKKTTNVSQQQYSKRAPLAECESSVVANSPIVENLPITYEKWSKRPSSRSGKVAETINEETVSYFSPNVQRKNIVSDFQDDEIRDQPMLVGDNFSHSSLEGIVNGKMTESIISIDRSVCVQEPITEENMEQLIEDSVTDVVDIKNQLKSLQKLLADIDSGNWTSELERLRAENQELKTALSEKDAIIASLRSQSLETSK